MKQGKILSLFADKETVTKKEVVDLFGHCYYHNGEKHIGDMLSRMVNNGLLIRIKPGVFKRGMGNRKDKVYNNPSQANLF